MKCCNRCGLEKQLAAFRRGSQCRACDKLVKLKWEANNRERHLASCRRRGRQVRERDPELYRAKKRDYDARNRERVNKTKAEAHRRRVAANPEKYLEKGRQSRNGENRARYLARRRESNQRRKEAARRYERERWHKDETYRLKCRLRWFLRQQVRKGRQIKTRGAFDLLGCSIPDFRLYLESKFESGMTWENYGKDGWHIDHIMPLAIFDLTNPEHQKRAFHFSNMQPLWAAENMSKSDKPPKVHQFNLI